MSVRVMSLVWRVPMAPTRKLVFLKLADCGDDDGSNIYPAVGTVARETGVSPRQVQRILREAEASGDLLLERHARGGRGNTRRYRIVVDRLIEAAERAAPCHPSGERATPCHPNENAGKTDGKSLENKAENPPAAPSGERVSPCHPSGKRVTSETEKGDTSDHKGCQSLSPNPSRPIKDPCASARARTASSLDATPFARLHAAMLRTLGQATLSSRMMRSLPAFDGWLDMGADIDLDIIPAVDAVLVRERAANPGWEPVSFHTFTEAVHAQVERRRARESGKPPRNPAEPAEEESAHATA